ncbi:hypothetical protein BC941DRAFT_439420 [Chlamydoabsidia padenii]|nr:hypothetical protein BC941DRAFT_439420 [Chlamydoabsidia padenii]
MESFGASSLQQGSVPMNPMLAMIQRQQQEQQQYEALTAGTTMGVAPVIPPLAISQDSTVMNSSHSGHPSNNSIGNNLTSYMNGDQDMGISQEQYQRHLLANSTQHRPTQQFNEVTNLYRSNRSPYPDMNSMSMQSTLMQQQQQMINIGNMSPSHSPAPNNTQFYSNVDLQSTYYSDPSMTDLQTSYMNMIPPAGMQPMDMITSMQLPLHQATSMPYISNNYPHISYSPVPQTFMASTPNGPYGNVDHIPGNISTAAKMGHPDSAMTSNLTSMPVQAPNMATIPQSVDNKFPMMGRQDSRTVTSPTTPTNPPLAEMPTRYKQPSSVTGSPTIQSPMQPSNSVTYIPKTRQVETYGGVDLKYFEKFEIRPPFPTIEELGIVDITALTLSLKSGIKMEMTNALNTLTTLTSLDRPLLLIHCDDLLDTLLNHLQYAMFTPESDGKHNNDSSPSGAQTYADLFEMSLMEMKSLLPGLEKSSSDKWLSSRELRLCLFNILRNLSFAEENMDYLATHQRLCGLLVKIIQLTRHHQVRHNKENDTVVAVGCDNDIRYMDILEFRKCILTIYANISIAMTNTNLQPEAVDAIVSLVHDFAVNGTDTYYSLLAMETWNKFSVHDHHRRLIGSLLHTNDDLTSQVAPMGHLIEEIWVSLITMIRRQFYLIEMGMMVGMNNTQLGTLELVVMGLYSVVALADLSFCEQLIKADWGLAMTILRICLTLAEGNNVHFRVVAQRGMELVYALILGGGVKVTRLVKHQQQFGRVYQQQQFEFQPHQPNQKQQPLFPITLADLEDEEPGYKKGITSRARILLDHTVLQEKLMMAMLKPTSDLFILSGLDDLLNLMADISFYE